jgi:hypothetical protein
MVASCSPGREFHGQHAVAHLDQRRFHRALGTGANQIRWTGNGGFSAAFANHFVDIGGAGATMTWATGNFVPNASWLNLAATNAGNAEIRLPQSHRLQLRLAHRERRHRGTARLSGVLSNGGVTYQGGGQVTPSAANTYTGITTIASGTTVVANTIGNGGAAGNLGAANNAATNLVFNSGTLAYTGAGETSDRSFTVGNANATLTGQRHRRPGVARRHRGRRRAHAHAQRHECAGIANELSGVLSNTGGGTLNVSSKARTPGASRARAPTPARPTSTPACSKSPTCRTAASHRASVRAAMPRPTCTSAAARCATSAPAARPTAR